MKAIVIVFALVFPLLAFASDGVYIEQEVVVKRGSEVQEEEFVKTWILGDLVKFESSRQPNYTIINPKRAIMWVVDDKNKVYMEFPLGTSGGEAAQGGPKISQRLERTGRAMKIGQWDCVEVELITEVSSGGVKKDVGALPVRTFVWLAQSDDLKKQGIEDALSKSLKKWVSAEALEGSELEGMPIQVVVTTEVDSFGKKVVEETTVTVRTIKVMNMSSDVFEIPSGYRQLKRP